jgi:MFS family permease
VSPTGIGVVFFVNTLVLVVFQLPLAKALGGHNRLRALALAAALFTVTSAGVLGVGRTLDGSAAVVALCGVIVIFSLAECVHGAVLNPLIADLAPPELMGRYMGLRTSSFQLGFLAGPTIGSLMLAASPSGLWLGCAVACGAAGAGFLGLAARTPAEIAVAPGPEPGSRKAFRVLWRTSEMTAEDPLSTDAQPAPHQAPDADHARTGGSSTA